MTLQNPTNQLVLGSIKTVTVTIPNDTLAFTSWIMKLPLSPGTAGYVLATDGSGITSWVPNGTSITTGNLTDVGTDGIVITGGTNAVVGTGTSIAQHVADATHNGYLSSGDWTVFNAKTNTTVHADANPNLTGNVQLVSGTGITLTQVGQAITIDSTGGSAFTPANLTTSTTGVTIGGGTNAVNGSGTTVNIAIASASLTGLLTSTDWNTFNNKQNALTFGNFTDAGTDGIVVTGGTGAVIGSGTAIAQHVSDASHNGYLSSTDWSTFNGKQPAGNYITALTGDVTATGPGSVAATLATVNSNVGSFTLTNITVNAKGLITAASSTATGNLTDTGTDGITVTNGTGAVIGSGTSIAQHVADVSHNGYLSSTDWGTFNSKQNALSFGNVTTSTTGVTIGGSPTGAVIGSGVSVDIATASTSLTGLLTNTDWNTFNGKQPNLGTLTAHYTLVGAGGSAVTLVAPSTSGFVLTSNGASADPSFQAIPTITTGNLTDVGTDGITITNGTGAVVGSGTTISQHVADATHNGYLSSADWNTFSTSTGANVHLSNLSAVAINADLLPGVTTSINLGSAALDFNQSYSELYEQPNIQTISHTIDAGFNSRVPVSYTIPLGDTLTVGAGGVLYIELASGTVISVDEGGTGKSSLTPYAVLCGGTTTTNPVQPIAGVGNAGQILTSNGAGALPTFQTVPNITVASVTLTGQTATIGSTLFFSTPSDGINHMYFVYASIWMTATGTEATFGWEPQLEFSDAFGTPHNSTQFQYNGSSGVVILPPVTPTTILAGTANGFGTNTPIVIDFGTTVHYKVIKNGTFTGTGGTYTVQFSAVQVS